MLHIEQEINEQPEIIKNLLQREAEVVRRIAAAVREFNPAFVYIAARGTSDNAARYAQYLFGTHARLPVGLATPSVYTLYQSPPNLSRAVVIGISQSGKSEDVCQVIRDARSQGALTVSITNEPESPLADAAQFHIDLKTGPEISVAATKTYTAQLTSVAMLVSALLNQSEIATELAKLPNYAAETLALAQGVSSWVQRYRYMERFVAIGRGYNYCTAFEISLKIKELCYCIGDGYSEADFRHGPFALIDPGFPVIVVAPSGKTQPLMVDFLAKLQEREAESLVISNDTAALSFATKALNFPQAIPEWLSPVVAVMPGQLFAMRLAIEKGHRVDQPRGITKVTVTR